MENNFDAQQPTEPTPTPTTPLIPTPNAKRTGKKTWITWLLVVITLWSLAASGYLWWQLQVSMDSSHTLEQDKQRLQAQINKLTKENAEKETAKEAEVACKDTPTTLFKQNIKEALDTKNTAVFATYTANPVKFVVAASEKSDDETPDEAAVSLEYTHSATGPWDFSLPASTIASFDAGFYTSYFDTNTYVGRSASGMIAAFDFNCDGKISQIFVAANEDLLH
jgi:cytoskeletal protein RodZ